ncbi:MAG: phosphoglycerate kinase [Syntrophomonadaceae bacterium]|nr:phosphoglycerate kinase [Syntrophomonadaceae bacterium]
MTKKSVQDIEVNGKRVLVRVDFNVPMDQEGKITDDTRIRAALPTIRYLVEQGAKVILASHLGRPKGKPDPSFSLAPVARHLAGFLGADVAQAPDCVGQRVKTMAAALKPGQVLMLENVRFHKEEEQNDPEFAKELAQLAEVYVNDAFGAAHRAHASTEGVARHLPAVAGLLLEKEISVMGRALAEPERPFVAIIGGAKVSDKISVLENLLGKVDALLVGGGMANTFLAAKGVAMGRSLVEKDKLELAQGLAEAARQKGVDLILPQDLVVAEAMAPDAPKKTVPVDSVPEGWMALDIGPQTVAAFALAVSRAKTVVWNGPMGVFEMEPFAKGTFGVAEAVAGCFGVTIVGGGDSVAALEKAGVADRITHISTGGGASLEFLEGKKLPGVEALLDK